MLDLYSIMPMNTDHVDEICEDIRQQQEKGISTRAMFLMPLAPEQNPPINKAETLCKQYDIFRDRLDKMGLAHGILVVNSIGNGAVHNTGHPFQCVESLTEHGEERNTCCPLDPDFQEYIRGQMRILAEHGTSCVMLDDDIGLLYRWDKGCTCPRHMAEFHRRSETNMTREELLSHILGKSDEDKYYRDIYIRTQEDSLLQVVKIMREGLDSVNPSIQGIVCTAGTFCEGQPQIARAFAGKGNPVIIRMNNGAYTPMGAKYFTKNMLRAAAQREVLKDSVDIYLAETDTCPQNRYSTSAANLHAHFTGTILEGATGAKHWITRLTSYEPNSGKAYRKILEKYAGFYNALAELYPTVRFSGCRIPLSTVRNYMLDIPNIFILEYSGWSTCVLERLGLPLYFSSEQGGAVFLDDDAVENFSDSQLLDFLHGAVFLSGKAANSLCERGLGEYIGVTLTDVPAEQKLSCERVKVNDVLVNCQVGTKKIVPQSDRVEISSEVLYRPSPEMEKVLFPGSTVYKNTLGGTTIVFGGTPLTPFKYDQAFSFLCETRKLQLIRLLQRVNCLPVYYPGDEDVYLRAGEMEDGGLFCAVFNLCLDKIEELTLCCEKKITRIQKLMPDGSRAECSFHVEQDAVHGDVIHIEEEAETLMPVVLLLYNL